MHAVSPGTRLGDAERVVVAAVLRRVPEQNRSWRQVERVIAAAEQLLNSDGFDEVAGNPARLAESAGIPSGSFYTYFTNADAVLEALRLLWIARFQPMLGRAFRIRCRSWEEAVDRAVDAVVEFFSFTDTRELWLNHQLSPTAMAAERDSDARLGSRVVDEITAIGRVFTGDEVDRVVFVAILDQLVRLAYVRGDGTVPDAAYVDRARCATKAFVAPLIASSLD